MADGLLWQILLYLWDFDMLSDWDYILKDDEREVFRFDDWGN